MSGPITIPGRSREADLTRLAEWHLTPGMWPAVQFHHDLMDVCDGVWTADGPVKHSPRTAEEHAYFDSLRHELGDFIRRRYERGGGASP